MTDKIDLNIVGDNKMHCVGCETRVVIALKSLHGIQNVTASSKTQQLVIEFDSALVSVDQVQERLKKIGFEAKVQGASGHPE